VYRFCLSQLRDAAVAEDVTAEVFASAYAAWPRARFDAGAGVRPWLYRIARNAVCDEWRRRGRAARATGLAPIARLDVESAAAVREELRAVIAALGGLRDRDRILLGLRLAGGLSHAEVATVLGTSEHAAIVAAGRALARLRKRLDVEGWT
jgi:RNA polymerase sigma-70 factor (ECF subfamily)